MRPELRLIIAQVFDLPAERQEADPSPDTVSAWDSLGHLKLVAALEASFGLRFNIREIQSMDSAAKIEAVLRARGR